MLPGDSFFALRKYSKGKINKYELEGSDELISYVYPNNKNLGNSKVQLRFDNDEKFFKAIGINEDDSYFIWSLPNSTSNETFYDSYNVKNNFLEGYDVWEKLNQENLELLREISNLILGQELDVEDENSKRSFAIKAFELYDSEFTEIISDYCYYQNLDCAENASERIEREINDYLYQFDFELIAYDGLKTTVANLISLFIQYNVPHESIEKLIKTIFKNDRHGIGGWSEDRWDFCNGLNFDSERFNEDANKILTSIMDKYSESSDKEENQKFINFFDRIRKKYKIGEWNPLPKNKKISYLIGGFNRENHKVIVYLSYEKINKKFEFSEESFYNLLYHPELFDFGF